MRVLGELRKLGFRVSLQTVRRYRKDVPRNPSPGWRTFLENHRPEIWASDFFTIHTLWFQTLYVFFFIAHDRRSVVYVNVTRHPTATWVWRQLINATPWGTSPRFLIRDRDRSYGGDFVARAQRIGIRTVLTPIATPQANAVCRAAGRNVPARVPGPHHRHQRAAPALRAPRVRAPLQRRAAAMHARSSHLACRVDRHSAPRTRKAEGMLKAQDWGRQMKPGPQPRQLALQLLDLELHTVCRGWGTLWVDSSHELGRWGGELTRVFEGRLPRGVGEGFVRTADGTDLPVVFAPLYRGGVGAAADGTGVRFGGGAHL